MKQISLIALSIILLSACGMKEENETLKEENASLKTELENAQEAVSTLNTVGAYLDSIDQKRDVLSLNLETGTSFEDYNSRMIELTNYVEESERKISELEASLAKTGQAKASYAATIRRLKNELKQKNEEISFLQEQVSEFKAENQELITKVMVQEAEIADRDADIIAKRQELNLLENRISELMVQSKLEEADAYFARAAAVEEAAKRTKLAPKKKRETYLEALDLYKKSKELGHEGCDEKIAQLQEKYVKG